MVLWFYRVDDPQSEKKETSRGHKHRRVRNPLQAVDRPNYFLDLGENDIRTGGEGTPLRATAHFCSTLLSLCTGII